MDEPWHVSRLKRHYVFTKSGAEMKKCVWVLAAAGCACLMPDLLNAEENVRNPDFAKRVRQKVDQELRVIKKKVELLERENEALRVEVKRLKDQWDNRDANRKLLENHRVMLESLRKMDWEIIKSSRIMIKALKDENEALKKKAWKEKTKGLVDPRRGGED